MLPSISMLYSLGRIISVTQFLSAALMRPLFPDIYPPEMTLFERRKLPYPETGAVLSMVTVFSGVTCLLWLALSKSVSAKGRVLLHVILLGLAAFYWMFIAVLVYIFTTRGSPFGLLVSSCANAGFASSVKCAAIGMQLCLPLATVAVFLGSALLVYIRARERYGSGKVQLPQVVRSPAWLLANVAELEISGSTQAKGGAPVHVMRFPPRTLYLLGLALSVFQGVSAFLLLSLFPRIHNVQDPSSTSFDDEDKPRRLDPRLFFAVVVWLSSLTCLHWCLMLARLRPKSYSEIGNVMGHVLSLAFGAMIWTAHLANFTFPERGPPGPFWNLVSTCAAADAGFASDAKCAGIALHLFLPYLNVISGLWIGWVIYRRALAVHGSGEIKLPPMYIAAWVEGRVGELDQPVENAKMKEELSAV